MFQFFENRKKKPADGKKRPGKEASDPAWAPGTQADGGALSASLQENIDRMDQLFEDIDIMITRRIQNERGNFPQLGLCYCDGLVNSLIINEDIIKPLILSDATLRGDPMDALVDRVLLINETKKATCYQDIIEAVTYGDTVLFVDGCTQALILNTKGFQTRSITEPESEKILTGPREGFNESLLMNLALVRRKVRSNELKMKFKKFGTRTNTQACVCYLDNLVNKDILKELFRRLDKIEIDGMLDTNYITEMIRDSGFSPFRVTGYTERPDAVVGKLLEGRIAIFLDGSPTVLTVPYLFIENFQSSEDYYLNFFYTSFSRLLRIVGFFLTVTVPGLYIAVVAFHHEMLPTPLLVNVASERQSVPLPAALEALIMLTVFDILRETGIRMPTGVGQALSIVGALVIGQAAVEAKLVAAPMIIVVGVTGITGLLVPKMNAPIIFVRLFLLLLASMLGFFGLMLGLSALMVHLLNLSSFGISQLTPTAELKYQELKDIAVRAPWWQMITRPKQLARDKVRMKRTEKN